MKATRRRLPAGVLTLAAGALMSAALYNRYPLTFWDTRVYVEEAGTLLPRPDRLIGYSVLIRALSFHHTLWPVVIAQCLLLAVLARRTMRALLGRTSERRYLALIGLLTVGSALPWIAGQLMADVFTPVLVMALWLSIFDTGLEPWQRWALGCVTALCVTVHLTHLPLGLGLVLAASGLLRATGQARAWQRVRAPLLALLMGVLAIGGFNYLRSGRATLASGSDTFLFGHLVDSGIASRLLDAHCPERNYLLCPQRASLPMSVDDLLWADKLELHPWQRSREIAQETQRMLRDSLREQPALHLQVAIEYTLRALGRFRTGEGLDADARPLIEAQLARFAPDDLPGFRSARQQANQIPVDQLRTLHTPVGWLLLSLGSLVLLLAALAGRSSFAQRGVCFIAFVFAALLLNAAISGNLSGIYDRYQSRLVWLVALGLSGCWPLPKPALMRVVSQLAFGCTRWLGLSAGGGSTPSSWASPSKRDATGSPGEETPAA